MVLYLPRRYLPHHGNIVLEDATPRPASPTEIDPYRLHPSVLDDLGRADALKAECERVARVESVQVDVEADIVGANSQTGVVSWQDSRGIATARR